MKLVMVGTGAFAKKHLDGIARIKGAEVASVVGRVPETTEAIAKKYNIPHSTTSLEEALKQPGVDAAIITSPTQVHAAQAIQVTTKHWVSRRDGTVSIKRGAIK